MLRHRLLLRELVGVAREVIGPWWSQKDFEFECPFYPLLLAGELGSVNLRRENEVKKKVVSHRHMLLFCIVVMKVGCKCDSELPGRKSKKGNCSIVTLLTKK